MFRLTALLALTLATTALADEAGGLTWSVPAGWQMDVPRPMRVATYRLPVAKGDSQAPELAVFYFGQGQGGAVDANVQRWAGQFQSADGKPVQPTTKKETVNKLPVTTVDLAGTYNPGMMGGQGPQKGQRLLGAIVEGPQGAVFFKLTGPQKSVAAAQKDFRKLVGSVRAGK